METTRQQKIARLLQRELSELFRLQTQAMHGTLVTVSAVRVSPGMLSTEDEMLAVASRVSSLTR